MLVWKDEGIILFLWEKNMLVFDYEYRILVF